MSATNELIHTVYEFRSLLRYLGDNYPDVLKKWSNGARHATTDDARCHEQSEVKAHDT